MILELLEVGADESKKKNKGSAKIEGPDQENLKIYASQKGKVDLIARSKSRSKIWSSLSWKSFIEILIFWKFDLEKLIAKVKKSLIKNHGAIFKASPFFRFLDEIEIKIKTRLFCKIMVNFYDLEGSFLRFRCCFYQDWGPLLWSLFFWSALFLWSRHKLFVRSRFFYLLFRRDHFLLSPPTSKKIKILATLQRSR